VITLIANGRLPEQPTVKELPGGGLVCEFRVLSNRYARGEEHVEAVNFVIYGENAARFAEGTEKGQMVYVGGTQETRRYTAGDGTQKTVVRYVVTHFEKGPRPRPKAADEAPPAQRPTAQRPAGRHATPQGRDSRAPQPSPGGDWLE
jgi:single-stranded DNA-binding protein